MDAKYTPGPWTWAEDYRGLYGLEPNNPVLEYYAYEGLWFDGSTPNQEANARLIAAAPDLLEALRDMVAVATADNWDRMSTGRQIVLESARAAIAKAEGA